MVDGEWSELNAVLVQSLHRQVPGSNCDGRQTSNPSRETLPVLNSATVSPVLNFHYQGNNQHRQNGRRDKNRHNPVRPTPLSRLF